jgi:hypothetical protein
MKTLTVFDDDYKTIMDLGNTLFGFENKKSKAKNESLTLSALCATLKKVNSELDKKGRVELAIVDKDNKPMVKYTITKLIP